MSLTKKEYSEQQEKVEEFAQNPDNFTKEEWNGLIDDIFAKKDNFPVIRRMKDVLDEITEQDEHREYEEIFLNFLLKRWLKYEGAQNLKEEEGDQAALSKVIQELQRKYPDTAKELVEFLEDMSRSFLAQKIK